MKTPITSIPRPAALDGYLVDRLYRETQYPNRLGLVLAAFDDGPGGARRAEVCAALLAYIRDKFDVLTGRRTGRAPRGLGLAWDAVADDVTVAACSIDFAIADTARAAELLADVRTLAQRRREAPTPAIEAVVRRFAEALTPVAECAVALLACFGILATIVEAPEFDPARLEAFAEALCVARAVDARDSEERRMLCEHLRHVLTEPNFDLLEDPR